MYVIQSTSQDFPDAAQRFNWCNCQADVRKNLGLGDTPIFDFNFWSNQLSGGGTATTTPAAAPSSILSLLPAAPAMFGGSWLLPGVAIGAAALYMYSRSKGGRRR